MSLEAHGLRVRHAIVCGLVFLGVVANAAQSGLDTASIRDLVERQMKVSRLPSVALAIVRPKQEVYAAAFDQEGTDFSPDTPFVLGSVTKTITALAAAQLVDAGRMHFDDPVVEHLPEFLINTQDGGRTITLRHLLTHTSGFSQWSGHDRRAQREGKFDHITPARPPGIRFEYSSLNYIVLGKVIEAVSGLPYGEYLRIRIFRPLGMRNSYTNLESARSHGLAMGHRYFFGLALPGRETQKPEPLIPAGFVISSTRDLGNYLRMLLNDGEFDGQRIVSSDRLREIFTPWDGGATGPGMAWGIGPTRIGHAGSTPTFSARLLLLRDKSYGIVVLTGVNSGPFFSGSAAVIDGVARKLAGDPVEPTRPDEIILKLTILALVIVGLVFTALSFRQWSRCGFPRRLRATRSVAMPLIREAALTIVVLAVIPWWIGVPFLTILEYFPDLGIAMLVGVVAGIGGALMRSAVIADRFFRDAANAKA